MKRRGFLIGGASIVGATSVGAVAFTQASVSREVDVDIVADDAGPILLAGGSTDTVTLDSGGQLTVDTNTSRADGLNGEGSFTYGDTSAPSTTHAFSMTNEGGGSRDFTFGLENFSNTNSTASEIVEMGIYDDTPTQKGGGNVTQGNDSNGITVTSKSTLYGILVFDTAGLTSADSLAGDITISAVTT